LLFLRLKRSVDYAPPAQFPHDIQNAFNATGVTFADSAFIKQTDAPSTPELKWRPTLMEDKSKTFTWEWEDGETGEIRTIKIPMPNLDRDYDPSESREIILDRKPRLDNVEKPDWIEIIPPRKPN